MRRAMVLAVLVVGCQASPIIQESGSMDSGTGTFGLPAGAVSIRYEATDREPWFGCDFGVALLLQPLDPLAPGQSVGRSDDLRIVPRGSTKGNVILPAVAAGTYFLGISGSCDWRVELVSAG